MINKITRQAEAELPKFQSHKEARAWFKEKYGGNFIMTDVEIIDGLKYYFYHLILDTEEYIKGREKLHRGEIVTGTDFLFSYQPIEIREDGHIHIIH